MRSLARGNVGSFSNADEPFGIARWTRKWATRDGTEIVREAGSSVKPYLDMIFMPRMGGPESEEETMKVPSKG